MEDNKNRDLLNYPRHTEQVIEIIVPPGQSPERIDQYLTRSVQNATRTKVQKAIEDGRVTISGDPVKPSRKIKPLDKIVCKILKAPPLELIPENIPLEISYEDDDLLVVNKPAGMVVHPGFGNRYGTLVNALLYHFGERNSIKIELDDEDDENESPLVFSNSAIRPGIVHRIDKDTSGLLVVAKCDDVLVALQKQFTKKSVQRGYYALVWGSPKENNGLIDAHIGRSSRDRKIFAVVKKGGKNAITEYEVLERYDIVSLLRFRLQTGRTHQIRVHSSHIGHPILGDVAYSGGTVLCGSSNTLPLARKCLEAAQRQMLHAKTLGFVHPKTNQFLLFDSQIPEDMLNVLNQLRMRFGNPQ